MREIEIKVRVHDKAALLARLKNMGVTMSPPITQRDVVYATPGAADNEPGANWLRIRTEDNSKVILTLKKSVVGHLDSIEHETVVDNAKELEEIIKQLGYELYSDLTKIRSKGKLGNIELCVDEVPSLGTFIEAEKLMQHDADHDTVVAELWQLLSKLDLQKTDEMHQGYDVLLRKQRGL
jgi:adenylate cyclase class 2